MNLTRLLPLSALVVGVLTFAPSTAQADCRAPSDCLCSYSETPSYVLDVQVPEGADLSAALDVEVVASFGDGVGEILGDDPTLFSLQGEVLSNNLIEAGERALVFLDGSGRPYEARALDQDGDLDCLEADARPAAEAAQLALSEDCVDEANVGLGPCDDTGCSITGAGSTTSLLLLALLALVRRRRG